MSVRGLCAGLGCVIVLLAAASLAVGPAALSLGDVLGSPWAAHEDPRRVIVLEIRAPRIVLAISIGFMLGLSGAAMQGLLRNPLAEPALFGAPQMAALFAVSAIGLGVSGALAWSLPAAAMLGAFVSVALLVGVAGPRAGVLLLILSGLAISALAAAGTALALNLAPNPFAALEIAFWLLGSLEDRSLRHVVMSVPFMAVGAALLLSTRRSLGVLTLGDDVAETLGVHVGALRWRVILGVAMGVGAAVAVAGSIGFIGLVAPHLMRRWTGHDPARLLWPAALTGAALLLAADLAARLIPATTSIKAGVLTAILGAPVFLALIIRERRALAGGLQP